MIKVFRRIRKSLLGDDRLGKYFLYALGEILLVVIGILIALAINNCKVAKNNETAIIKILKDIQGDLLNDIIEAEEVLKYYEKRDSICDGILHDQYNKENYRDPGKWRLVKIGRELAPFIVSNGSYFTLIDN